MKAEYLWPMVKDCGVPYDTVKQMPIHEIIDDLASFGDYQQQKNYQQWLEFEEMGLNKSTRADGKLDCPAANEPEPRWSTWDIQSPLEYDMFWVPKLGNEGWANMMSNGASYSMGSAV